MGDYKFKKSKTGPWLRRLKNKKNVVERILGLLFLIVTLFFYGHKKLISLHNDDLLQHSQLKQTEAVFFSNYIDGGYRHSDKYPNYSYTIDGKRYTGTAPDKYHKISDITAIEYVIDHPEISRPVYH